MKLKHLAFWILMLAGIFGCAVTADAAYRKDYEVSDDYMYSVNADGKTCTLQLYLGNETDVTIPAYVNGYRVKALGSICFCRYEQKAAYMSYTGDERRKSITVPEGVEEIDLISFETPSLEKLVLPSTLVSLKDNGGSLGTCDIVIPESNPNFRTENGSVYSKDRTCLVYVKDTKTFQIPESVTVIGERAFCKASSLESITVPGTVKTIQNGAFEDCYGLTEITVLQGVENIGEYAFGRCPDLKKITIPGSVKSLGYACFYRLPATMTFIFRGSEQKLKELDLAAVKKGHKFFAGLDRGTGLDEKATIRYVCAPEVTNIVNTVKGVHVYWKSPGKSGCTYDLYRSFTKNGGYDKIATTASTNYTDQNVVSGKTYYYKVRVTVDGIRSDASEGRGITFVSTPDITVRVNSAYGIRLYWETISGATGYAIYRKGDGANEAWARVATIPSDSEPVWTDQSTKPASVNGTIFHYTVRALAGADMKTLSGCRSTGRTMVRLNKPVLTEAQKAGAGSVKCSWSRNDRATGYELRFMQGAAVVKTMTYGNNAIVSKTVSGLVIGTNYKVQVRSYYKTENAGTYYSPWSDPIFLEESIWQADVPIVVEN